MKMSNVYCLQTFPDHIFPAEFIQLVMQEWSFMVRGAIGAADAGKPPMDWLTNKMWKDVVFLDDSIPALKGLRNSVSSDVGWHQWFLSECPQEEVLPGGVLVSSLVTGKVRYMRCLLSAISCTIATNL
jgi:hypothetical protein